MARLSLAVTTGSSRIAIEQLQISAPGGPLKFSFTRKALAKALKAAARSARATRVNAKVQHAGVTLSYTAAASGTASLVLPLKLKHAIKHRLTGAGEGRDRRRGGRSGTGFVQARAVRPAEISCEPLKALLGA